MRVVCDGWCGQCYANVRGRAAHKGHRRYVVASAPRPGQPVGKGSYLKRSEMTPEGHRQSTPDSESVERWPALVEFLAEEFWPDGKARRTGSLTLFFDTGRWKVALNDRDQDTVGFGSCASLASLLDWVDRALRDGTLDWRHTGRGPSNRRRT